MWMKEFHNINYLFFRYSLEKPGKKENSHYPKLQDDVPKDVMGDGL